MRRLILESMGFEGVFKAAKDYLQPILKAAAIAVMGGVVMTADWSDPQKTAVLVGPVYFVLYMLGAVASRHSHRLVRLHGGEERAARFVWGMDLAVFAALLPAMYLGVHWAMIVGFVLLHVMQNFWRPVLISRIDACSNAEQGATILSIESQAKSFSTMIAAPVLGFAVDFVKAHEWGGSYWPVGALGLAVAVVFFAVPARAARTEARAQSD